MDTGAQTSCMSMTTLNRINPKCKLTECTTPNLRSVGNTVVPILGVTDVEVSIGSFSCSHKFHIIDNFSHDVILGVDFMKAHNATVEYDNQDGSLFLEGVFVSTIESSDKRFPNVSVITAETFDIPSRSIVVFPVIFSDNAIASDNRGLRDCVAEPLDYSSGPLQGCKGAHCIISRDKPVYHISNDTDQDITVQKGIPIARISPINKHSTNTTKNIKASELAVTANNSHMNVQVGSKKVVPLDGQASANELNIDFSTCALNSNDEAELVSMVEENSDVFAKSWADLGCTDLHTNKIDTGEAHPIR